MLDRVSVEEGLSQASIHTLAQDNTGYIWLGTENGINIYDGYSVSTLSGPENDFHKHSANTINITDDNLVWIAMEGKGLYTYSPKSNEYNLIIADNPDDRDTYVWQVEPAIEPGYYWIVTDNSLLRFHLASKTIQKRLNYQAYFGKDNQIYNIRSLNNRLFITTRSGLYVYDLATDTAFKIPAILNTSLLSADFKDSESAKTYDIIAHGEQYYVGTNDGIFSFSQRNLTAFFDDPDTPFSYQVAIPNVSVWQLIFQENTLYAATTTGLYRFNTHTQRHEYLFKFSDAYAAIADPNITKLFADKQGRLWLASQASGAYIWDPKTELITTFSYSNNENSLTSENVTTIVPSDNNALWVATSNGLNLIDLSSNHITGFIKNTIDDNQFTKSNIYDMKQDFLGRLWLFTAQGIILFDPDKKILIQPSFPEATKTLFTDEDNWLVIESIDEYIWFVNDKGIYHIHAQTGEATLLSNLPDNFNSKYIWKILPSFSNNENEVLISSTDTLWQYNVRTQQLTKIFHHPGLPKGGVSYIDSWARDNSGLIWLSFVQVGLIAISPDDYQLKYRYNDVNSILDINTYGVQIDEQEHLWLSSHAGLFSMNLNNKHMRRFTYKDGLSSSEFNDGAFAKLNDGRLAYGGISGLNIFEPMALNNKNENLNNSVSIVSVSTLSRPQDLKQFVPNHQEITLQHDDVGIRIDFSDFSFGSAGQTLYKYGFIGGISYPESTQNFASFPQLAPGRYTFSVSAKSAVNGHYSKPAIIRINVKYALWKSPFMKMLYVVILIGGSLFWLRNRQQRQQELLKAHKQVKYRENRLQLALSGSNSEVWDWKARGNVIYGKRIIEDLGYVDQNLATNFDDHVALIHPQDQENFINKWRIFVCNSNSNKNISFECTYRLKAFDGRWLWYRDLGKIVALDEHKNPRRITGTYTNITDLKVDQERAQYYGAAFEQTRDWVLILDENLEIGRANKAMADVFGWDTEELTFSEKLAGIPQKRIDYYRQLLPVIYEKGHWRGEEVIKSPQGQEYHVITNISISISDDQKTRHFICVYTDISAQKIAENELRTMANYDHLTGLPNRALLLDRVNHAIASASRRATPIALFFIDLDRFKQINDSLGHKYGDLLLQEVSQRLNQSLRGDDTLARIGGDEFIVLLERFRGSNELGNIAQKFIDLVEQPFVLDDNVVSIGASIGIALCPDDATDAEGLFRNADIAMYHAKQLGRNNYQFFTPHMNIVAKDRLMKESRLKLGIANNEFFNVYQPVIDAHTGKAIGAELLMRWRHNGEIIPPSEFIELAEELGLIATMTEKALERGLAQLKQWRAIRPNMFLSINLSAKHFSDKSLFESIERQLTNYQLPGTAIKAEVTESAFFMEPERAITTMNKLSEMGILLSLDDFGTGFSSLSYLKKLPLDIIKIDRSFISGIGIEKTDEAIIDATLVLAKSLNMYCIAEGVETQEQLEYLVKRGCHLIQGFLYYKPLIAEDLIAKLTEDSNEIKVKSAGSDNA